MPKPIKSHHLTIVTDSVAAAHTATLSKGWLARRAYKAKRAVMDDLKTSAPAQKGAISELMHLVIALQTMVAAAQAEAKADHAFGRDRRRQLCTQSLINLSDWRRAAI